MLVLSSVRAGMWLVPWEATGEARGLWLLSVPQAGSGGSHPIVPARNPAQVQGAPPVP